MPVIVNLFEEMETEEKARKRDLLVVARQVIVVSLLVALALGGLSWLWQARSSRALRHATIEWEHVGDLYEDLVQLNRRGAALEEQSRFLINRVRNRVLWAPVLADLADRVPDEAQITKLTCERKTIPIPPDPATLMTEGGTAPATRAELDELVRAHTRMVRALQVFVEGLAFGDRAELVVDAFRTDLQKFSVGEEFTSQVRLGPLGTAKLSPAAGWTGEVKRFVIDCDFREQDGGGA